MTDASAVGAAVQEWSELLDAFEQQLDERHHAIAWTAPSAPLPPELVDRARTVLDRQLQVQDGMRDRMQDVREQLDALRRVQPRAVDAPAYLDVIG